MQLRFATYGAAAGWADVVMAACPFLLSSEEAVLHDMAHHPGTLARYVVVEDGEVLGLTRIRRGDQPGELRAMLMVHPEHQGRGVGRMLLDQVDRVADGNAVAGIVNGDERSLAVATHWGFTPDRSHRVSSVDPRTVAGPGPGPEGLQVVPLTEVTAEQVWSCLCEVAHDDPSGLTRPMPLEEFEVTEWSEPLHRADLGVAVLDGGTVVAYTQTAATHDRAWTMMTGTLPSHRGRGLALLVKQHALAACAAAGITRCSTGNDDANASMLAVNDRLGYVPSAVTWGARRP